jgi:hypothetical protein
MMNLLRKRHDFPDARKSPSQAPTILPEFACTCFRRTTFS